ncbi:DUF2798 domain-containing protein [Staphylococcus gallinarum]|uniref:DUF2798 domain-containing protein n=1 Tax=Staphylococcus gallinarum TaxID=1293 RepID=UPI001E446C37|nr:DUF2798 domain-containing protein [Staphylococcus gallinarum]MCD8900350.1 DUF2798 domain-containing protein [Staphylococcus gallinarum]MCD8901601.1 DUF2798 domain-containing protein [Staphylococcus gallinarum]MEB6237707.1 DUF2798 domain-containing protein [Staphylococcus gallinarum]
MPTTKKESLQFGFIMCFGMVFLMTIYNLCINETITKVSFLEVVYNFIIAFVLAFILDLFIVGPSAKKVALYLTAKSDKKIFKILAISIFMVLGMAGCMSIYGLVSGYIHNGFYANSVILDYLSVFSKNVIFALPLQILIMGPLVRYIFTNYIKNNEISAEQ